MQGYAIAQVGRTESDVVRADHLVVGFACMAERVAPNLDVSPLVKLAKKLESGVLLNQCDLVQCRNIVSQIEATLIGMSMRKVKSLVLTEQIAIEIERANHHEQRT